MYVLGASTQPFHAACTLLTFPFINGVFDSRLRSLSEIPRSFATNSRPSDNLLSERFPTGLPSRRPLLAQMFATISCSYFSSSAHPIFIGSPSLTRAILLTLELKQSDGRSQHIFKNHLVVPVDFVRYRIRDSYRFARSIYEFQSL